MEIMLNIYAVIVCYEPSDSHLTVLLSSLSSQSVEIIIIDNSEKQPLTENVGGFSYLLYSANNNIGIAKAQNVGIRLAKARGADIISFFDQDSVIPENFIQQLTTPIVNQEAKITAPVYKNEDLGFFYPIVRCNYWGWRSVIDVASQKRPFWTNVTISSGTCVKSETFDNIGIFNEDFFIDHVDTEWFMRAWRAGYEVLIIPQAVMKHTIGDDVIDLFGRKLPVHSPERRYYRLRNGVLMLRLAHIPKLLSAREVLSSFIHQIIIIIFRPRKMAYCHFYFKGILDGIKQRRGKLS